MAFDHIAAAILKPGKLVTLKLNMLPGDPEVELEHLGETNGGYMSELAARAGTDPAELGDEKILTPEKRAIRRMRWRGFIAKHAVRHLHARHSDGKAATDADIPEFCEALPPDVVDLVFMFARDPEHWRERPLAPPDKIAEKS